MTTGMADGQIGGQGPEDGAVKRPAGGRPPGDDPPSGSRAGRFLLGMALYVFGAMNIFIGWTIMALNAGFGLGLIASAALIMPITRRLTYRVTGQRIGPKLRIALFFLIPIAFAFPQVADDIAAKGKVERESQATALAAEKPGLLKQVRTLIDAKAYEEALARTAKYKLAGDADLNTLRDEAQRGYDAAAAKQAELQKKLDAANKELAEQREQARCQADDDCFAKPYRVDAMTQCRPWIEAYARYDIDWTYGITTGQMFTSAYVDRQAGTIRFSGNQLKLQNGFGAWQRVRYECVYSIRNKAVISAQVNT